MKLQKKRQPWGIRKKKKKKRKKKKKHKRERKKQKAQFDLFHPGVN